MLKTQNRVLSKDEIGRVVKYHTRTKRRKESPIVQLRFAVFRLSCCCGLRCKEICGVTLGDFFFESAAPFIRIRKDITKGHRKVGAEEVTRKPRKVSMRVSDATRHDLKRWYDFRMKQSGGDISAPFIAGQKAVNLGKPLNRHLVASIWKTAIRVLGVDRVREVSIHAGRHTAISHLVRAGVSLAFVRDWAGHRSIATTSHYIHSFDEESLTGDVF